MTVVETRAQVREARLGTGPGRGFVVAFCVYLFLLTWLVLFKLSEPWIGEAAMRHVKLVPYVSTPELSSGTPVEMLGNVLMFVPFGLYLGVLFRRVRWWRVVGVLAGTSLGFECVQYVLAVGSFDTTDIVNNTVGGLLGWWLVVCLRRFWPYASDRIMSSVCLGLTVLAAVLTFVFVLSPIQYR